MMYNELNENPNIDYQLKKEELIKELLFLQTYTKGREADNDRDEY